jgi:CRP-like cAMP-binding protein
MSTADRHLHRTWHELFLSVLTGGADLETWVIDRMTSAVEDEDVEAGKRLYAQGEQPEYIFFVREGQVRLEREGRATWILEGRSAVGTFDAALDRPHERTAVAGTRLHLFKLRVDHWQDLLEDSYGLARSAVANSVRTVAGIESRLWAAKSEPRGFAVGSVGPLEGPLSFIERMAFLAQDPLIRGAGIQVMVELADSMKELTFEPGAWLYERGHPRGEAFFMLHGEVVGERRQPEVKVHFGPGSVVGGVASLGDPILDWNARAVTQVRALSMRLEDWFDSMEEHFDLVRSALAQLARIRENLLEHLEVANPGDLRVLS